jgi:GWxTD domain-containing protein
MRATILLTLAVALAAAPAAATKLAGEWLDALELTNVQLGPAYAQWLVGAVGQIASKAEREAYLTLRDNRAAQAYIAEFWQRHADVRALYDERSQLADKRFTEAAYPGAKTDRGTILILYGEPREISFEDHRNVEEPTVELWLYDKDHPVGLHGMSPDRQYRFTRVGDLTRRFVKGRANDPAQRRGRQPTPLSHDGPFD